LAPSGFELQPLKITFIFGGHQVGSGKALKAKSAEVSFHLHMTEDRAKVEKALKEILGIEVSTTEILYGHNGNLILDTRTSLSEPDAGILLKRVLGGLGSSDKSLLLAELQGHIDDKGTFFLRLDKQQMVLGRLAMAESDAVRLRIRLDCKGAEAEGVIRECLT
jgi:RNA binding exosome subunit